MLDKQVISQEDEIDLGAIFATLFKYKFHIITVTLMFLFIGMLYAFISTKWLKTTAIVEVAHHFANNKEQYIADFSKFRNDVLAYGNSILDQNESEFKNIYVDNNLTDKSDKKIDKTLGYGFYAINIVSKNKDKSLDKISEILKSISLKYENELVYIITQKSVDLQILNKNIQDTRDIILADANYQIQTLKNEAPKIAEKIEQITKVLIDKNNKDEMHATYTTQIGGSDYGLSSLIQYRNNMITNSMSAANAKLFEIQTTLEKLVKQKNILEKDIKDGYENTKIVSVATTPEKNKNLLIIAIMTFIGFFVSIFGVLVWDVIRKYRE